RADHLHGRDGRLRCLLLEREGPRRDGGLLAGVLPRAARRDRRSLPARAPPPAAAQPADAPGQPILEDEDGMVIMRPVPVAPSPDPELVARRVLAQRAKQAEAEQTERAAWDKAAAEAAARIEERNQWYRAPGIKPGLWAWFRALPDLAQALILG